MLDIALELSLDDPTYESMADKFFEHFYRIAASMDRLGEHEDELWDEADGFFYDLLRLPNGSATRLKVQSMVGLLPLCVASVIPPEALERFPETVAHARAFLEKRPHLAATVASPVKPGADGRRLFAIADEVKLRRVLAKMLDEEGFLSPYGIRSVSRYHRDNPYAFTVHGEEYRVDYVPAESSSGMFGGNSNWRGPIWVPVNTLIIRALLNFYAYYGDEFTVECPTGSGRQMTLFEVARELSNRMLAIFRVDEQGRRPVFGGAEKFQDDPNWRDHLLFYEYFHGDNGAGLGASHQTGWTGVVGALAIIFGDLEGKGFLDRVRESRFHRFSGRPAPGMVAETMETEEARASAPTGGAQ